MKKNIINIKLVFEEHLFKFASQNEVVSGCYVYYRD